MSLNLNKCTVAGNLTADPDVRKTNTGLSVCSFTLAVNRSKKDGEKTTEYIRCQAWRQSADFLEKYAHKGSEVYVDGSIHTRSYDKQDGSKAYITEVVANEVQLPGSGGSAKKSSYNTESMGNTSVRLEDVDNYPLQSDQESGLEISSDDLPF